MIKVFNSSDNIFTSNGDAVITGARALIHKADNADYYLELETPLDYIDYIKPQNIIVVDTPTGAQGFRISKVENTRTKIKAYCLHLYYDSNNYLIADSFVVDKTCNDALEHLNEATDTESPFTVLSDVTTVNSYRCVRKSLNEAISTVLERWGGHLVRDNFNIQIKNVIGNDNGVTIQYAKNLKEISVTYNFDSVCTKLLPVGKDGFMLDNLYLYSEVQYDNPYTKTVSFEQDIELEDYSSEAEYLIALRDDLVRQAQAYLSVSQYPAINYTLSANLEKITDIGDIIQVYDERLGVNITTSVISFIYDAVLGRYTEIQFGNAQAGLSDLLKGINEAVTNELTINNQTMTATLNRALAESEAKILGTFGNSYVVYNGDEILVLDSLPKETAHNVIRINSAGIGFSVDGGAHFTTAWLIDGTFNAQAVNVINFTADLIKGGTLMLGANANESGALEVLDASNNVICTLDKDGLKMFGINGNYIKMNTIVGFAGYDRLNNEIFSVNEDKFVMKKSVVEQEITLCNKVRFIPIEIRDNNNQLINDGIGLVSVFEGV